jgi:putative transposase
VRARGCIKSQEGSNAWSMRKLSRVPGIGGTSVHRLMNEGRLKPHERRRKSPDPEFDAKQAAILGLCLDPPDCPLVLSVDEKTSILALVRTQPMLPLEPGRPRRQTLTYAHHRTACISNGDSAKLLAEVLSSQTPAWRHRVGIRGSSPPCGSGPLPPPPDAPW